MLRKILIALLLVTTTGICLAETAGDTEEKQFPYKAQIVGSGVYVRSGPAIQYYYTTQVSQPQVVTVVGNVYSWYKIVPPKGSFSWVRKDEVMIDTENPGMGIITGDNVRIWAGRSGIAPEDSTSLQVKLNKGDKVKLLGEESGDYYKISPPDGAFLWVNAEYLKYLSAIETDRPTPIDQPVKPDEKVDANTTAKIEDTTDVNEPAEDINAVVVREPAKPVKTEHEIKRTKEVYDLIKQIDTERQKPLNEQDYEPFKDQLKEIIADEKAGTASRYAQYQLDRIGGYELAKLAEKELASGDIELEKLRQKIAARRQKMYESLKVEEDYVVKGTLKKSLVFADAAGAQRYLIVDDNGKIICYAVAVDQASYMDMTDYVGKIVGLRGQVVPDSASGIGLVKFDTIELIEE